MSTVFYRWGAGRDESRVTFDGTHISVFDLKREIVLANKMGNGKDFDIKVYDNVNGEEFKDDNHQIPRSSSLVARRLPAIAKGRGTAQNYIVGTSLGESLTGDHRIEAHARDAMLAKQSKGARGVSGMYGSMSKRFDGREDKAPTPGPSVNVTTGDADEDARIKAMFQQQADALEQDLDDMTAQPRAGANYRQRQRPNATASSSKFDYSLPPDKEPPPGYICYRCGQKGHWIQNCPENENPEAADRKRFTRVTGIPRMLLRTVDAPVGGEGSSGGAMLTADGGFVRAIPDERLWKRQTAQKPRALNSQDVRDQQPLDDALTCPICKKLVWEAVRVPCCDTAFCEECITTYLVDHAFECPSCESKVASLDKLRPDEGLRDRVRGYVDGEIERSKKEAKEDQERQAKNETNDGDREEGEEGEEGAIKPEKFSSSQRPNGASRPNANGAANDDAQPSIPAMNFDPVRMQEMLNPQVMQRYTAEVNKMMNNPKVNLQARTLLQAQLAAVKGTVMQMQLMGMTANLGGGMNGMGPGPGAGPRGGMNGMGNGMGNGIGNGIGNGMNMGTGMNGMDMGMNMPMDMGMGMPMMNDMNMNMGMGMGMNGGVGMNMGYNGNMGMPFRGGGGGRGFRGRGRGGGGGFRGGGGGFRGGMKRHADDAGFDGGGMDKQQRMG